MVSITSIKEDVENVMKIANELKNVELKQAILDLKSKILDLNEEILSLREENSTLKQKIENKSEFDMVFRDNAYYNKKDNDGPYCPACWQKDQKVTRMIVKNIYLGGTQQSCPVCKHSHIG